MIFTHAAFQWTCLCKGSMAFRALKIIHLGTWIGSGAAYDDVTWRIVWGQNSDIICSMGHGRIREGHTSLAQMFLKSFKLLMKHDPRRIDLQSAKEVAGVFSGDMHR